eukprot:363197-Chlamydomonas_euryale.AAC.1
MGDALLGRAGHGVGRCVQRVGAGGEALRGRGACWVQRWGDRWESQVHLLGCAAAGSNGGMSLLKNRMTQTVLRTHRAPQLGSATGHSKSGEMAWNNAAGAKARHALPQANAKK